MLRALRYLALLAAPLATACMEWDYGSREPVSTVEGGLFVVCEGNFQYGNASLTFYDPATRRAENDCFLRANGFKLGDVGQSMTLRDGIGWIVVNTSKVIFAVDAETLREVGRITGLTSPRHIAFVDDTKAYVTQLWDPRIAIVDPRRFAVTGYIECPGMDFETGSTEQMILAGDYMIVNCWSYQNRLLKIDTRTDRVVAEAEVGIQPAAMALDARGKLWVFCDGGYEGSPYGSEPPQLVRLDAATLRIEQRFPLRNNRGARSLVVDAAGEHLHWIDGGVWRMETTAERLPHAPLIPDRGTLFYALTVDPRTSELYVADAIDYQQPGTLYRYSPEGELLDSFTTGITPGAFCWR